MSSSHDFYAGSRVGEDTGAERIPGEPAPAEENKLRAEIGSYLLGLALAIILTVAAFWAEGSRLIYGPGIVMAIAALAVAQIGVHLVFFLHLTTDPDNVNNTLALAFGILIVGLVIFGSVWVMNHLNHNMLPMQELMRMQP